MYPQGVWRIRKPAYAGNGCAIFPVFGTEEWAEKIRSQPQTIDSEVPKGTLIMDATCCPADISYPQDIQLLNEAREKLEHIADAYCEAHKLKKPRMRRRAARKDYLKLSKCKKRTAKKIREGVRKQLQYIRRDIGFIVDIIRKTHLKVTEKVADLLNTITTLYGQQLYMYENRVHTVPDRIVSIETVRKALLKLGYRRKKKAFHASEQERPRCGGEAESMARHYLRVQRK